MIITMNNYYGNFSVSSKLFYFEDSILENKKTFSIFIHNFVLWEKI